ncbi:MAG TPA: ATP synthase F1 subunit delta [Elusimicrobiota bacterium]|jgi:F-type H+-transporting ATPase subunit delta|nr:ATP synthase F1 subunit delta [Elusimicrobiota bacterium]
MKSSDHVLAGRYAEALFQAAADKREEQAVQAELASALSLLLPQDALLRHPRAAVADKKKLVRAVLEGKVGAISVRFVELLLEKERYELLPAIATVYGRLAAEKRGVAHAVVRSARALSPEARKTLTARLKAFAGKDIELDVKEDPELIGGVSVKIGDWVLDSSLRGQLRRLRESIQ